MCARVRVFLSSTPSLKSLNSPIAATDVSAVSLTSLPYGLEHMVQALFDDRSDRLLQQLGHLFQRLLGSVVTGCASRLVAVDVRQVMDSGENLLYL